MRKNYDVIIVGAGPAGIFCAYELIKNTKPISKKILLVERGELVENRKCPLKAKEVEKCIKCKPFCTITNGFSGAGAYSDGKLSYFNEDDDDLYVGGNLHKYTGVKKAKDLIRYTLHQYIQYGAGENKELEGTKDPSKIAQIRKRTQSIGYELISVPICHIGTDKAPDIFKEIEDDLQVAGVDIRCNTETDDLIIENNKVKGIIYHDVKSKSVYEAYAPKVVIAVGRGGADWLLNMCNKYNIKSSPATIDIGIRYELPNDIMFEINEYLYEGKIIGRPNPFNDKVRTFCQNPSGYVSTEVYANELTLVNGQSYKNKGKGSDNTNLALLVSLDLKGVADPMEYTRNVARNMNALADGQVLVQRLEDIKAGKRTWQEELEQNSVVPTLTSAKAGDISLAMPYRELTDILKFIEELDKVIPGFANGDNLLYAPEIKFYSNKVDLTQELETSVSGLYAIGDGCGLTRGLMMASASGVHVARSILKKL